MRHFIFAFTLLFAAVSFAAPEDSNASSGIKTQGFLGIGINPLPDTDFRSIYMVALNSPASDARLAPGDYIVAVDGQPTEAMKTCGDLVRVMQGQPETAVRLQVKHAATGKTDTITLTRIKKIFPIRISE
jgi:C-terminal processing protease CtpA/Prc